MWEMVTNNNVKLLKKGMLVRYTWKREYLLEHNPPFKEVLGRFSHCRQALRRVPSTTPDYDIFAYWGEKTKPTYINTTDYSVIIEAQFKKPILIFYKKGGKN